jgi:hypothetical protein
VTLARRRVWNASGWRDDRAKRRYGAAPERGSVEPTILAYALTSGDVEHPGAVILSRPHTIEAVSNGYLPASKRQDF